MVVLPNFRYREEIFDAFGRHLWPDEEQAVRRKRMKATTSAYDMDAGANIWERRFGNPRKRAAAAAGVAARAWRLGEERRASLLGRAAGRRVRHHL